MVKNSIFGYVQQNIKYITENIYTRNLKLNYIYMYICNLKYIKFKRSVFPVRKKLKFLHNIHN